MVALGAGDSAGAVQLTETQALLGRGARPSESE